MANNKNGKTKIGYASAIIASIVAIVIFCVISVIFGVMPLDALPANYIGAALGSLIGALITLVLLRGQTDIEEKKGKDIRILETKTKVFQDFIRDVWQVWEDQVITIEEFQKLTSQYYQNLMIYLKDEARLKAIGNALTEMGRQIDKTSYNDTVKLRDSIVNIINTLSAEIDLGGKINTKIMDEHDEIVFPVLFRKKLLDALNEALNTKDSASDFKEGKYESIWEADLREFITFELRRFPGIKLTIGQLGREKLSLIFMADRKFHQINEFRNTGYRGQFRNRFGPENISLNNPIPDDEDKTPSPVLDFSKKESMEVFRTEKRNFPSVFAKRVKFYLDSWKLEELGIIEFLEKHLGHGSVETAG